MKQRELFELAPSKGRGAEAPSAISTVARSLNLKAACLFSSAGIGELGISACGINIVAANELVPYRVNLYRSNFDRGSIIEGDIWTKSSDIVSLARSQSNDTPPFLVYATPPCQGMSSNGLGKIKSEIAQGRRAEEDERNRLIIPTLDIITQLRPLWVLLENVPGMRNTTIRTDNNKSANIIEYAQERLGPEYTGRAEVIACDEFGIPQKRKRLITIFTRDPLGKAYFSNNGGTFFCAAMGERKKTLREAIAHLPHLDAKTGLNARKDFHPQHYVPVMDPRKYWWVSKTPQNETAFNNQCADAACGFRDTPGHVDVVVDGRMVSSKNIPIHCAKCGALLPRPTVIQPDGQHRLLKGFHSAYRRMPWDEPARTITQNFIYEASDNKIHPDQNRVLSGYEAMIIQTIDRYPYDFSISGVDIGLARVAEVIGESVPPYLIEKICTMMIRASFPDIRV